MAGETVGTRAPGRWSVFWIAVWLAVALIIAKAVAPKESFEVIAQTRSEYLRNLAVLVHQDLMYAVGLGVVGAALLFLSRRRQRLGTVAWISMLLVGVVSVIFAVASVPLFRYLGTPLTYPMLHVAGGLCGRFSNGRAAGRSLCETASGCDASRATAERDRGRARIGVVQISESLREQIRYDAPARARGVPQPGVHERLLASRHDG